MIPDFPDDIRIRLATLNFFLLHPDVAKSLPCWLSQFSFSKLRQPTGQRQSNIRTQQKSFNCYEESLVSSNLNSNLLRFHCAHPTVLTYLIYINTYLCFKMHTHTIVAFRKCSDWRNGTIGANHTSFSRQAIFLLAERLQ